MPHCPGQSRKQIEFTTLFEQSNRQNPAESAGLFTGLPSLHHCDWRVMGNKCPVSMEPALTEFPIGRFA
jgi:hypothetical protein